MCWWLLRGPGRHTSACTVAGFNPHLTGFIFIKDPKMAFRNF
ncbi:hypothetical protein HMPREF0293_1221 [Corynebacterium glucuronolyticum ATCC 51866]|uniref:Uncharacterized protein n=1 Tax=Corynebacterium glucuronolyticum ATCC 51866 TaxID=548478 RepID=A0ABM9XQ59_9CORY|nr:hypothetical protein HMPREF0293_1221 [Corynebacterium glucuronolyticum ATCC 51866]